MVSSHIAWQTGAFDGDVWCGACLEALVQNVLGRCMCVPFPWHLHFVAVSGRAGLDH